MIFTALLLQRQLCSHARIDQTCYGEENLPHSRSRREKKKEILEILIEAHNDVESTEVMDRSSAVLGQVQPTGPDRLRLTPQTTTGKEESIL